MRRLWQDHPRLLLAFLLALSLSAFFAGRLVWSAVYWAGHRQEVVQPWMTLGYVGRSWQLDPREIMARLSLPLPRGEPLTLQEMADMRSVPVDVILIEVERAIATLRAEQGQGP